MLPVETPFKIYTGLDGRPLQNGYVWFGLPNQDPITNPVTVYWDAAGTIPATQPLRTINGYIMRAGTPANVFYDLEYSELVQTSVGIQVFYSRSSYDFSVASSVKKLLNELSDPSGSSIIGFHSGFPSSPSVQTVSQVLDRQINLANYSGYDPTGETDNSAILQEAIDDAVQLGNYTVIINGVIRIDQPVRLRGGVCLDGGAAPGYYAGMPYYDIVNSKTGPASRIIAGAAIPGGMIQFDDTLYSAHGFGIRNIIIDGNKMADNGIAMNPAVLTERVCRLNDVLVQGAVQDGIRMQNVLVQMWNNVTVASCHGFGVNLASGVSDSQITNLYVHTCDGGGVQVGDGCANVHFRGGKIEDNYANGMQFSTLTPGNSLIYLTDFSVNANNGDGLSNNGANVFSDGCTFYGHNKSLGSAAIYNAAGNIVLRGGTIFGNNYNFHQNGGVIDAQGVELNPAISRNVVQVAGSLTVQGDTVGGVPMLRNPGARRLTTGIAGSSSASVTFKNSLAGGLGAAFFNMKAFNLTVTYAQYPQTPDAAQSFIGQVIIGQAGTAIGASVRTIAAASSAFITGVTASVSGNDIIITVSTGASWGNVSGHTTAYISLEDIGHNIYS